MHRRHFFSGLMGSVVLSGCGTRPESPPLRVLTYNTHHGEGNDGRVDLARIAAVIQATHPDVVALQELDERARRTGRIDQVAELNRLTGLHGQFGQAMPYDGGAYGQAILSRWPLD